MSTGIEMENIHSTFFDSSEPGDLTYMVRSMYGRVCITHHRI